MIPLFIIMLFIMMLPVMYKTGFAIYARKTYALPVAQVKELSWPSRDLLKSYNRLADNHKPYANIVYMLKALDIKHDKDAVNAHFSADGDGTWACGCHFRGNICHFQDYFELKARIDRVHKAVKSQDRAVALVGVQDALAAIDNFKEDLDREVVLIVEATEDMTRKQLTGG